MRFGFVHRLMTNALAALGVLALVSSGQFSTVVSIIVLLGMGLALAVRESWQRHRYFRHVDTVVLLLIVGIQVTRFVLGASSLDVIIEFAAALQIVRLATRRGAAHDQQVERVSGSRCSQRRQRLGPLGRVQPIVPVPPDELSRRGRHRLAGTL